MKPATLIDPEEGQPLLADSSTTRRATPKVLAAAVIGLLGVAAVASSQTSPSPVQVLDAAPLCNSSVETSAVSAILPTFVETFNNADGAWATTNGMDPWNDVINAQVNVPCDDYCNIPALYQSCASRDMDTSTNACTKSFIDFDLTEMQGLSDFQLGTIDATSMTVNTDDTCAAPDGAACAFSASFPVTATSSNLVLTFHDLNFQCKCVGDFGSAFQTEPFGNVKTEVCTWTDAVAKGTLTACFAGCEAGAAMTSATISNLKIEGSTVPVTTSSCQPGGMAVPSNYLSDFATDLYKKVNAPIEDAINDYFADSVLPSVDSCSS